MSSLILSLLALLWSIIVYHHLVYPLILKRLRVRRMPGDKNLIDTEPVTARANLPRICILIPAFNEADVIADKIRNLACLDYPASQLSVVIACDGCSDNTAQIARNCAMETENRHLKIDIFEFPQNQGKVAILNRMIGQLDSDLVALSDASALISIDGLLIAAAHFHQPRVAVVAATYKLLQPGSNGEAAYWQYQTGIKLGEAAVGNPIGVHGALYLFRRALFSPLQPDTINDDFVLPMQMVAAGYQAVYEPAIIALELEQASRQMDQRRRIRIAAGNLQQLLRLPGLLAPAQGWTAFNFFSGKALRAIMPLLLLIEIALCGVMATGSSLFLVLTLLQLAGFLCAWLSSFLSERSIPRFLNVLFYLANGYRCSLIGIIRYAIGQERGGWKSVSTMERSS